MAVPSLAIHAERLFMAGRRTEFIVIAIVALIVAYELFALFAQLDNWPWP